MKKMTARPHQSLFPTAMSMLLGCFKGGGAVWSERKKQVLCSCPGSQCVAGLYCESSCTISAFDRDS